jgi:hypothetical protein
MQIVKLTVLSAIVLADGISHSTNSLGFPVSGFSTMAILSLVINLAGAKDSNVLDSLNDDQNHDGTFSLIQKASNTSCSNVIVKENSVKPYFPVSEVKNENILFLRSLDSRCARFCETPGNPVQCYNIKAVSIEKVTSDNSSLGPCWYNDILTNKNLCETTPLSVKMQLTQPMPQNFVLPALAAVTNDGAEHQVLLQYYFAKSGAIRQYSSGFIAIITAVLFWL